MSADIVDDIETAEDLCGRLAEALRSISDRVADPDARTALAAWDKYCRPTCGFRAAGECSDDPDTCGCPCGHEPAETPR